MPRKPLASETLELLREKGRAQFATPESRAAHSALTRDRIAARASWSTDVRTLQLAWRGACPEARRRFLSNLLDPLCWRVEK